MKLRRTMRLLLNPSEALRVLIPPADIQPEQTGPDCISPLLVYADLVLSDDPRN